MTALPDPLVAFLAERYGDARRLREERQRRAAEPAQGFAQAMGRVASAMVPWMVQLVAAFSTIGTAPTGPDPHTHHGRMTLNLQRARARRRALARLKTARRNHP